MTKRLEYLDICKAMAIILVVMGHVLQYSLYGNTKEVLFNSIYSFHMPLFVLLSGYSVLNGKLPYTIKEGVVFITKRARSLLLPFVVWGILVELIIINHCSFHEVALGSLSLLIRPDRGAWFLISLFSIHFLFVLTWLIVCRIPKASESVKLALSFFLGLTFTMIIHKVFDIHAFYWSTEFYLAYWGGQIIYRFPQIIKNNIVCVIAFIIGAYLCTYYNVNNPNFRLRMVVTFMMALFFLNISINMEIAWREKTCYNQILSFGRESLTIYLVHTYLLVVLFKQPLFDSELFKPVPFFIWLLFPSILIAWLSIKVGEMLRSNSVLSMLLFGKKKK